MARKGRGLLITLCVIIGLIVIATVAVRLFLTREKLIAMVVPRVEKAVDAKVTIGDIGVKFPFGFGVDIEDISFEKALPDTSALAFSSEKVTVRASLMSLIRRKPEITAADVRGGAVTVSNPNKRREVKILGIDSHFSMTSAGDAFALSVKALTDSVLVSALGMPPAMTLEKVGFDGELEINGDFSRLVIKESKVSWEDLVTVKIKGEVVNIKTAPRMTLTFEGDERPLAPILEKAKGFKLDELSGAKARAAKPAAPQVPVEMTGGMFGFAAQVDGLAREPLAMNLAFEFKLKDLAVKAGELASIAKVGADFKGQGVALAWQSLFPSPTKPMTPAEISMAWQAVKLEGKIGVEGGTFVMQDRSARGSAAEGAAPASGSAPQSAAAEAPMRISSLKAEAEISGPDVTKISGEFTIGTSPYKFNASMLNVMCASAELVLTARSLQAKQGQKGPPDLGPVLDGMVNAPVVHFELSGRSFDARPYQQPLSGAKGDAKAPLPAGAPQPQRLPAEGGAPGAIIFLKNTSFTVKLDSVIAREAVITGLEAKGTIRDGRVRVEPATFAYAGGKGAAVVNTDLRKAARVETKVDFSLDGVEADQALSRLHSFGSFIQGKFSVKSNAAVVTGPGINPLAFLTAAGSALSSKGTLNIESFIEPLAKIQGFDVAPFKKFDFKEWSGNFFVKDGRFVSDDWKIDSSRGDWAIKGSFGFDGTLDYAVHVVIPSEVQRQMKDVDKYKGAFDLMRDKSGNLVLDMKIGGTAQHPSASLDLTNAKSKVQDKLMEGLKKKFLR